VSSPQAGPALDRRHAHRASAIVTQLHGEDPATLRARLAWHAAVGGRRTLDPIVEAVERRAVRLPDPEDPEAPEWLLTCAELRQRQRTPGARRVADHLASRLPLSPRSVPALAAHFRSSAEPRARERALTAAAAIGAPSDPEDALALHAAWTLDGDPARLDLLRQRLGTQDPTEAEARIWPLLADLRDLPPSAFPEAPVSGSGLLASVSLALPPLRLTIFWHYVDELSFGPVAEALTFPWPALRPRLVLSQPSAQVRFLARLGDGAEEELEDVAVVGSWLEGMCESVDRTPFLAVGGAKGDRR
jgi:hypothetical protein